MERERTLGSSQEAEPNNDQKKETKRKKSRNLRLTALIGSQGEPEKPVRRKGTPIFDLADLVVKKQNEAAPDTAKETGQTKHTAESAEQTANEAAEHSDTEEPEHAEPDNAEDTGKAYERLPVFKLGDMDLGEGEVIVHLQGDKPIEERVRLIHQEATAQPGQAAEDVPGETPEGVPETAPPTAHPEQHLNQNHEAAPDTESTASGGGEVPPTLPPEAPAVPFEQPPERPQTVFSAGERPEPAQVYREYMMREALARQAAATGGGEPVTRQELNAAVRAGQNRGLIVGAVVGGAYEHIKHKRREKKAEKRYKAQSKQLEAARQEYKFGLQGQEQQKNDVERRLAATERQLNDAERRFGNARRPEKQPANVPEQAAPDEQLNIPPEHRLQSSAWHRIEIDAKTGKPVENPAFQYGHEYYRERAHESTPAQQRDAATGELALAAAAMASQQTSTPPGGGAALPPVDLPSATMQGPPPPATQQAVPKAEPKQKPAASQTNVPLWPWLLALAIIVICLIFVLR